MIISYTIRKTNKLQHVVISQAPTYACVKTNAMIRGLHTVFGLRVNPTCYFNLYTSLKITTHKLNINDL